MVAKKKPRGGRRQGAGRKPLTGESRENRVVAFVSDGENRKLKAYAGEQDVPVGRAVYLILARFLKRRP